MEVDQVEILDTAHIHCTARRPLLIDSGALQCYDSSYCTMEERNHLSPSPVSTSLEQATRISKRQRLHRCPHAPSQLYNVLRSANLRCCAFIHPSRLHPESTAFARTSSKILRWQQTGPSPIRRLLGTYRSSGLCLCSR